MFGDVSLALFLMVSYLYEAGTEEMSSEVIFKLFDDEDLT